MDSLSRQALYYYKNGAGCCQCILRAAEHRYGLYIPEESYRAFSGFANGYGVGGMCAALNGAIAVLGLIFDENEAKTKSLLLLSRFRKRFGGYNCSFVYSSVSGDCSAVISSITGMLENVIEGR